MIDVPPIHGDGFQLRSLSPEAVGALLARDIGSFQRLLGVIVEDADVGWIADSEFGFDRRLALMRRDASTQPWLDRAIVRDDQIMLGHIGFHDPPDETRSVEMGYGVFPAYYRQGHTTRAARTLMDWATTTHGIARFVVSVGVENAPSLALASKLGFTRIGEQMDERDGLEIVFELVRPSTQPPVVGASP